MADPPPAALDLDALERAIAAQPAPGGPYYVERHEHRRAWVVCASPPLHADPDAALEVALCTTQRDADAIAAALNGALPLVTELRAARAVVAAAGAYKNARDALERVKRHPSFVRNERTDAIATVHRTRAALDAVHNGALASEIDAALGDEEVRGE